MTILKNLKDSFTLDERSLALYRFFLGLLVMADVISRLPDLTDFYTDMGLVPRGIFVNEMSVPWSLSFHLANGSLIFAYLMFSIHFILGLMLAIGLKTRWAILGSFLMAVSVHNRNWLVNNGGDDIFRAILFISIFLPLNRTFSIDSALHKTSCVLKGYFSAWGMTLFFQVFAIYFVSYVLKYHDIWRKDYSAFYYSSRLDIFATPLGIWLRDFPTLGKMITFVSIYLEMLGPLLLILSFLLGRRWWIVRTGLVITFIAFHFGIFLTMNIGLFTFICEAMWLVFLPAPFWDKVFQRCREKGLHRLTIYYDGGCDFCQKSVRIIKEFLLLLEVTLAPVQEDSSLREDMEKNHSWIVVNAQGERFFHFNGWTELMAHSPVGRFLVPVLKLRSISWVGGKLYDLISHQRNHLGKVSQFFEYNLPKKEIRLLRRISEATGCLILTTLIMWNLTTIKSLHLKAPFFQSLTQWLHLYQEWNMFAPFPKTDNIWVEIPAKLSDGSEIDLLTGDRDIYSIKDKQFVAQIKNEHWRKFFLNLSEKVDNARYYGGYLCRKWNNRKLGLIPNTTVRKMEIIVFSQQNLPEGDKGGIERKISWNHWCFDEDFKRDNPRSSK